MRWNLDKLYPSFEGEAFQTDFEQCGKEIQAIKEWAREAFQGEQEATAKISAFLKRMNEFYHLYTRLHSYAELTLSVEAKNERRCR